MINMESLDGKNLSFQRDVGNVTKNLVLFSSSRLYDVTPKVPQTSPKSKLVHCPIDWLNCILCQTHSREALQCPALIKRNDVSKGAGYETLLSDISSYHEVGYFPVPINSTLLGEQKDVVELLLKNEAKWHKNCRNKFSKLKLTRLHKHKLKVEAETDSSTPNKITRKSCGAATVADCKKCFFCNTESGDLHQASTFEMDTKVRQCASELQDTVLLAKLSAGDLISQEAMYHSNCLVTLYNRSRKLQAENDSNKSCHQIHGIALAELVSYIEESKSSDSITIHKLADLAKMYSSRLANLGVDTTSRVNTTRLKERIMEHIPDIKSHKQGRDVLLVHNEDIGKVIKQASEKVYDDEAIALSKVASMIRRDIFNPSDSYDFNGTFSDKCQQDSIPKSLKALIEMILRGPNIVDQENEISNAQNVLSIAQLIVFNSTSRRRNQSVSTYHTIAREPALPIYIGLMIHAETRKRGIIDKLNNLGISISYNRVLELSTKMGNSVCDQFEQENIVCPSVLRRNIFTTAAVDNIDHNPSSTTAHGSFHGTGISIFQHPTRECPVEARNVNVINKGDQQTRLKQLPDSYANIPPVAIQRKSGIPEANRPFASDCQHILPALQTEKRWLEHVRNEVESKESHDTAISWSAFHANVATQKEYDSPVDIGALLPLFNDEAKSVSMIRHSMSIIAGIVHHLNPGQIPVMTCDQPLYALAKQIQWDWPDIYGEAKFVILLGGLHIEIAALKTIGDWLQDSGWTHALVQANIASAGIADSFLKASHVARSRHAHQVTACALYILMYQAYQFFLESHVRDQGTTAVEFNAWRTQRENESPQFLFWSITLKLEQSILMFVRSLREGNFKLYRDTVTNLLPWFFALDHPNYARWLSVHVRDLMNLDHIHPDIAEQFENGRFVIRKTHHAFSSIPIDQAHEQNNKLVKGDGGAIGLTENSNQLLRWMVSGPEIARALQEFEQGQDCKNSSLTDDKDVKHHEQNKSTQVRFGKQVKDLCAVIEEFGNPFNDYTEDLLVLDTRDILDDQVKDTVKQIERVGKEQFETFITERFDTRQKPVTDPIKKNKFPLFSRPAIKEKSKEKQQISSLKDTCSLFSKLYVSCQVRKGDLDEFFLHENSKYPPSISQFGHLRFGCKSELLNCLEQVCPSEYEIPDVDVKIFDGAAIINILKPNGCQTFLEYSQNVFIPFVERQIQSVSRVDIAWDEYITNSLKATTRGKRGQGIRRRVQSDSRIPGSWEAFLRVDENKTELFGYLADQLITLTCDNNKQIITTKGSDVLSNTPIEESNSISPCTHEEADTRLLLHVAHAARLNNTKVLVRTVDTDVVVIAITVFFQHINVQELWIAFGTGKQFRYIPVHKLCNALGQDIASCLSAFHAFTGCDQTSSFCGKGKKTAWGTLKAFSEAVEAFKVLSNTPTDDSIATVMPTLERFVILMYDRSNAATGVNEARKDLFTRKGRSIDGIPPTHAALLQHTRRTAYQAGYCWGQALLPSPELPCPSNWGWVKGQDNTWEPFWTTLQQASESCQELLKCSCSPQIGCRGRCKCIKADMMCTALCLCGGDCDRG